MAYLKKRKNKNKPDIFEVVHSFKQPNGSFKPFILFKFYNEEEANRKKDEVNFILARDGEGEYVKTLLSDIDVKANFNALISLVFQKYVEHRRENKAHDDDKTHFFIKSHLKRLIKYASSLLEKNINEITTQDIVVNYKKIFVLMNKGNYSKLTLKCSHNETINAILFYYGGEYAPSEIFNFKLLSKGARIADENSIVVSKKAKSIASEIKLTPEIFKKLYSNSNARLQRAMLICMVLGCRFGLVETQNIKYSDFFETNDQMFCYIKNGKRKKDSEMEEYRVVPVPNILVKMVEKWKEEDENKNITCDYVINYHNHRVVNLSSGWKTAKEKSGLSGVKLRPYKHRHTLAQILLDKKMDRLSIAHMLGHTSTKMLDTVYATDTSELQKDIANVSNATAHIKGIFENSDLIIDADFKVVEKNTTRYDYSTFSVDELEEEVKKLNELIKDARGKSSSFSMLFET